MKSLVPLLLLLLAAGCASRVGVRQTGERAIQRQLNESALSADRPSLFTRQFLARLSLAEPFQRQPVRTLATLHEGLGGPDEADRLFALAELSLLHAERRRDPGHYMAAAVYAYVFLFPDASAGSPLPYDPRQRLAMDIYNRGLVHALQSDKTGEIQVQARRIALPFGVFDLSVKPDALKYDGQQLSHFVSVADLEIVGLRNRYRTFGIGAALSAGGQPVQAPGDGRVISRRAKAPVTLFVRMEQPRQALAAGRMTGHAELYDTNVTPGVGIGGRSVPLEAEPSAALAYTLDGSPLWDFEIAGFRRNSLGLGLLPGHKEGELFLLNPYRPGRIPVVFVHGTASSPARWAQMVNDLLGDASLAGRYQFWFFIYTSGSPVALSSMHLRESLERTIKTLDPEGKDPALQRMVVIGHSQGGLLTKMTAVESGDAFWRNVSKTEFAQADLSPETRDLLGRSMFVKPLPFVTRVIFIATPHRGSFVAENMIGKLSSRLIHLPANLTEVAAEVVRLQPQAAVKTALRIPTSVDNMDGSNPFVRTLAGLPLAPGVKAHSIVPVKGRGPAEKGNDGVVRYASAHIEGVESELVVRSGHSTQSTPETIEEVRRILYEHAAPPR